MSIELKIKSKHLSLEAKVIRFEEKKLKKQIEWCKNRTDDSKLRETWESINHHRRWNVRNENRATFLARAYISGKDYRIVEKKRNDDGLFHQYIKPRIVSMVVKYKFHKSEKYMKPEELKEIKDAIEKWCE